MSTHYYTLTVIHQEWLTTDPQPEAPPPVVDLTEKPCKAWYGARWDRPEDVPMPAVPDEPQAQAQLAGRPQRQFILHHRVARIPDVPNVPALLDPNATLTVRFGDRMWYADRVFKAAEWNDYACRYIAIAVWVPKTLEEARTSLVRDYGRSTETANGYSDETLREHIAHCRTFAKSGWSLTGIVVRAIAWPDGTRLDTETGASFDPRDFHEQYTYEVSLDNPQTSLQVTTIDELEATAAKLLEIAGRLRALAAGSTQEVIVQKWEESERGWGTRPDGYSLHLTEEDRKAFVTAHWAALPDEAPYCYSQPSGTPYRAAVNLNPETLAALQAAGATGLRIWNSPLPGDGGTDGWMPVRPATTGKAS